MNVSYGSGDRILPVTTSPLRVDGLDPPQGGLALHVRKEVVPLRLKNQVVWSLTLDLEPDDEVVALSEMMVSIAG